MKLKVNEIKNFRSASIAIKNKGILPIHNFIKFENGIITKTNSESFLSIPGDFKGSCLIDEKILYAFIDSVKTEEIEVKVKDKLITLTDGKIKHNSPTDSVELFPSFPDAGDEKIEFDNKILWAINYAYNFTTEDESNPYKECVMVGKGIVGATNGFIAYTEKHNLKCNLILHRDRALAISKFESVIFSENDNFQFFTAGNVKYAFVKKDTKFVDLTPFSSMPGENNITLDKDIFIRFCNLSVASTPAGAVLESEISGNCLVMRYPQHNIYISTPLDLPLTETLQDFRFNPGIMLKLLKSIPDSMITLAPSSRKYFITGESGFVSLIMEMQ